MNGMNRRDFTQGSIRDDGRADGPSARFAGATNAMTAADEGAGTVLGIMLIVLVTVMIVIAAGVGRMLVVRSHAATAADLSALSAANALWEGGDPCEVAAEVAEDNGATMIACRVGGDTGEDVTVRVGVDMDMPFLPHMTQDARAGPTVCE